MKFTPLNDNVLVQRVEALETTIGGLFIPGNAQEKMVEGMVKSIGSGHLLNDGTFKSLGVSVGQRVLFEKFAGHEVKIDGQEYLILKEANILGIFND